jgi:AraC family transcriptional regulator
MPNGDEHGKVLRGGEFYSPVQATLRTEDVQLSELRQPCSRKVPRHEHELAYVTVVLRGDYCEGDSRLEELQPFTAVFKPCGIAHKTEIGPAGAYFFTVEFREGYLRDLDMRLPQQTAFDAGTGGLLWPGLRLFSSFRAQAADPLVVESDVMEMLGAITQSTCRKKEPPAWLGRVKERLHEEFSGNLRMRDLASDAGVHPVHLARVFRAQERQTPGDYLQRLRTRAACRLLRDPDYPLASIAAECGFADQSHFTRVFRKLTSTTPAKFRDTVRAC